jgi:hypothetical protein
MSKKEIIEELTKVSKDEFVPDAARADALAHLAQLKQEYEAKLNQITFKGKPIDEVHVFLGTLNGTIDDATYNGIREQHKLLNEEYGLSPFKDVAVSAL